MKYTLLQPQGITTLKLQSDSLTIPLSTEQIRELFRTIAQAKGISGESKTTNDITESKQSQGLDSGSVYLRSGVSGDSLSTNDNNLPQANCNKMVEFSLTLNDKHEMLNNEGGECVLADYIATFESGEVFVNLGCCFLP